MLLSMQSLFRWLKLAALLSFLLLAGCMSFPAHIAAELETPRSGQPNPYAVKKEAFDLAEKAIKAESGIKQPKRYPPPDISSLPLKSGQLVVVDDTRAQGIYVGLFADVYVPWTHIGILSIEADGPVVYDTNASLIPLPGLPPNAFFIGRPGRIPLDIFVKEKIAGVYSLPPEVDPLKVVAYMRHHYERATPFDSYFDMDDATALYCSELVSLALIAGGAAPTKPRAMRENRSYTLMRQWLNMRSPNILLPGQLIDQERLVARWSNGVSPAQIDAHFELRRELFRRFDADVSIGSLLEFKDSAFDLRESINTLREDISIAFAHFEGDLESIRREVVRRSQAFFVDSPPQNKPTVTVDPR
jgi:hypothetical protein